MLRVIPLPLARGKDVPQSDLQQLNLNHHRVTREPILFSTL